MSDSSDPRMRKLFTNLVSSALRAARDNPLADLFAGWTKPRMEHHMGVSEIIRRRVIR
jgi:hypothetical protein